jgi:hypothetical protein
VGDQISDSLVGYLSYSTDLRIREQHEVIFHCDFIIGLLSKKFVDLTWVFGSVHYIVCDFYTHAAWI